MDRPSFIMRPPRSFGRTMLGGIILVATFGAAVVGGTLLHANVLPARRLVARILSDVLSNTFNGRIRIQNIGHIDAGGFDGADATVDEPAGARVLTVHGLRGRASLFEIVRRIASGSRYLEIDIAEALAEHVDLVMANDVEGIPTVARAFEPRPSPSSDSGPSQRVRVWLPEVELHRANVRGNIAGIDGVRGEIANVYGSVLAGTDRTSIRVRRFSLQAGGIGSKPFRGTAETRIEVPSSTGNSVSVWGVFDGNMGDMQVNLRGGLDGQELSLTGDVLRARPEAVREFLPWWPVRDDANAHVQAHGKPSNLFTRGSVHIGTGDADFAGQLSLERGIRTTLAVEARDVDLRSFDESAPSAALSTSATVTIGVDRARGLHGSIEASVEPWRVAGLDVPPASVTATIAGERVSGKVVFHDRELTSEAEVDVHPGAQGGPVVVDVDWTGRARAMERVPWLAPIGQGELAWRAKGAIVGGRVQASVDGTVARFVRPGVALGKGRFNGTVRGPFDALTIDASLEGTDFHPGPLAFDDVRAKAEGPLARLAVVVGVSGENQAKLGMRAIVESVTAGTRVHDAELAAARGDVAVFGKVRRIEVIGDRVAFEGISVDGAGGPVAGTFSISPTDAKIHMSAENIDLAKLGAVFLPGAAVEGRLAFDVDAAINRRDERGHARVRLEEGRLGEVAGVSMVGEADVSDGKVSGGVDAVWGTLGSITVTTSEAELAGSPLSAASWQNAQGRLQIEGALDLDRFSESFAAVVGPLGQAGGAARAKIVLSRTDDAASQSDPLRATTPDVDLLFWTDGLRIGKKADPVRPVGAAAPGFSSDGVDLQLTMHVDGDTPTGALTARLVDTEGVFAGLSASSSEVRLLDFWRDPARVFDRLTQMPMTAELTVPRRNLAVYPSFARLPGWRGEIEGKGTLTGSVGAPVVGVHMSGHAVEPSGAGLGLPVDLDAQAHYDGKRALARVRARRPEGVVFDGMTQIDARIEKVLARIASASPGSADTDAHGARAERVWEATGRARLYRFPLASVPLLAENVVGGFAGGVLTFRGLNRDPEIEAQIDATNLTLDAASFPTAIAELRVAKGRAVLSARLDQTVGGASATAVGSVKWDSPIVPEIDTKEPLDFYVEARDLRAAALYPLFLRKVFSHFDGRLNGTMHARQAGEGGQGGDTVEGAFDLQDGSLLVPEIGQEFRKASAHIAVTERGHVEISNVSASGATGRLTASGKMVLKGLAFESAEGQVRIAQKEAIPLTVEGVSLGDAWGMLMLHAKMADEHTVKLDVDVPTFHADMPESSSRDVQALADNPEIEVGIRRPGVELVPVYLTAPVEERDEDALAWQVKFYLGQDAVLKLGSMMKLTLGGEPVVTLTDRARVEGVVELRSGAVEVFGKRFEIEHGKAEFAGDDPSNPNVTVTARWEAPDGTRIYADYVGPLRTGLLSLRSLPARSQSEVLATLLYGTGSDTIAAPGATIRQESYRSNTAGALLAGGAVSTSVNRVLASVTPLDITTRVTSDAQSPTPEVAFRVSPRVSAMLSYRTRTPTLNEKPDRVLVTLDWRFRRNWSLVTTIGNLGGSVLDLIWKYRY